MIAISLRIFASVVLSLSASGVCAVEGRRRWRSFLSCSARGLSRLTDFIAFAGDEVEREMKIRIESYDRNAILWVVCGQLWV